MTFLASGDGVSPPAACDGFTERMMERPMRSWCFLAAVGLGIGCLADAARAAEFEVLILKDGQRVTGQILTEKPGALYVDLGFDILRVPRDQIVRRAKI